MVFVMVLIFANELYSLSASVFPAYVDCDDISANKVF